MARNWKADLPRHGLYIFYVWGSVEPKVHGPYDSHEERIEAANKLLKEDGGAGQQSGIFPLDLVDGVPVAGVFTDEEVPQP